MRWLGGALILVSVIIGAWRGFDAPSRIRSLVEQELNQRGLAVQIGRVSVTPFGRIVAKDVRILQKRGEETTTIEIGRVRFWPNWFSWWRRQPWINRVSVHDTSLRLPLTPITSVHFEKVKAHARLEKGLIVIEQAQGRVGQLRLQLTGTLAFDETRKPEAKPKNNEKIAQAWERAQRFLDELDSTVNVKIHLDGPVNDPLEGRASLFIESEKLWMHSLFVPRLTARAAYENHSARLDELHIEMARGALDGQGVLDLDESRAEINLTCALDPTLLAPLLPEAYRAQLESMHFRQMMQIEGLLECQWQNEREYFARLSAHAENFQIGAASFDQLRASLSFDGTRLLLYDVLVQNKTGELALEFLIDADRSVHGKLTSSIDWTNFKSLFPPKGQPFFESLEFAEGGPQIECTLEGNLPNPDLLEPEDHWIDWLEFSGTIEAKNVSYTNGNGTRTTLAFLASPFRFAERVLHLSELKVTRVPGEEARAVVDYDFKNRLVSLENARGVLNIQKTAPIFGPKMESYVQPYRLRQASSIEADGVVDLKEQKKTSLKLNIQSNGPLEYDFLHKTLLIKKANVATQFEGQRATVQIQPGSSVLDGELTGRVQIELDSPTPPFIADVKGLDLSLQKILHIYFNKDDVSGLTSGQVHLDGRLGDLRSLKGTGTVVVTQGDIYQIPVFGGLSDILGYSKASDAQAIFSFLDGKIHIDELEMTSSAFAVIGHGSYDYMKDDIDLSVRVNMRGIAGIALFPISKLFEYQGRGPLGNAQWESKVFGGE